MIGCKPVKEIVYKEIPVEIVKTEYKDVYHFDSIYLKENVYIYQKGDTIFRDSTHIEYIEKQVHDTLITHDTIPQIVNTETIKEVVKNKPQWWPVWLSLGIVGLIYIEKKTKWLSTLWKLIFKH